ncbi:MAG TPA: branched-chain amino acid ABC transporter permease [Nitrososphaerales archaeon]|nr:branched-chain amino acid ABC transporter permease [Nitrososphaerales archaeon]
MALPQLVFFGIDLVSFGLGFLNFYALYLAISLSLNLEFGFAGIPNFGKVMFIAGGASFAGSISGRVAAYVFGVGVNQDFIIFNTQIISAVDAKLVANPVFTVELVLLAILVAAGIGALLGYLSSYPAIRLREDYLGMLLLGSGAFFQVFLRTYSPLIGGAQNIAVPDPYAYWSSLGTGYRDLVAALVVSAFAILVFIYSERVARSPLGRVMKAVRDNEDASRALGKDDAVVRRNILIISSAIAGMAGAIFTFYIASAEYDIWTRFAWTFWPFLIVIVGGAGNNVGVALGTFFFTLILKGLQQVQPYFQPYVFFDVNWLQDILFATLLIAILLLRPDGILKERPTPTLSRSKVSAMVNAVINQRGGRQTEPKKVSPIGQVRNKLKRLSGRREKSETAGPP